MLNDDNTANKKRPISTANLMRPPSRHKLPTKQIGLNTPLNDHENKLNISKKRPNTSKLGRTIQIKKDTDNKIEKDKAIDENNSNKIVFMTNSTKRLNDEEKLSLEAEIEYEFCKTDENELEIGEG